MYLVLEVGTDARDVVGFDLLTGAMSAPIHMGWVTGLYAYSGGLIMVSVTQVNYYTYDGTLQHTYNAAFFSGGWSTASSGDGTVFVAANTACDSSTNPQVALEKVTPSGVAWTWMDPTPVGCSGTNVAATPDGGAILQRLLSSGPTYSSITGGGVRRWEHKPTPPATASEAPGYLVHGPLVDTNGVVALPETFSFACATSPNLQCRGIELEFVTQTSNSLTIPTLTIGTPGTDDQLYFGINFNSDQSPGPSNIAIDTNRVYLTLVDHNVPDPNGAFSLSAFDVPGLARQYPTLTASVPPPTTSNHVSLTATPKVRNVGDHVTLLAKVTDSTAKPLLDTKVRFQVMSGPDTGFTAITRTDTTGTAAALLQGKASGTDTVQAWLDDNMNGVLDPGEAFAQTTVNWLAQRYVALGDSYSSGEGAIDSSGKVVFDAQTNVKKVDECHRSTAAYPQSIKTNPALTSFTFAACSGAILADIVTNVGGPGQWAEGPQLDSVALPSLPSLDTSLVTLSIGGNDAGFADGLNSCTTGFGQNFVFHTETGCIRTLKRLGNQGIQLMTLGGSIRIDKRYASWQFCGRICKPDDKYFVSKTIPRLSVVLQQIHVRAPNAKIRVLVYPHFFPQVPPATCIVGQFQADAITYSYRIAHDAMTEINSLGDQLDDAIIGQVKLAQKQGINIDWVDPRNDFVGHGVKCISDEPHSTSDPWINGAIIGGNSIITASASVFSFHPMAVGHAMFASELRSKL